MGKTVLIIVFFLLTKKGKDGIIMADNRIAYGLAKKYGIDTSGMSPKEVWEALKKKGVTEENISVEAYDSKENKAVATAEKVNEKQNQNKQVKNIIKKLDEYKDKPIGTYNYHTGELVNLSDGYMVTFHQNEPDEQGHYKSHFGRYTEEEYDKLANDFAKDNDAEIFIGVFDDEPEISFKVKTLEQAIKLMLKHNQDSVWDNKLGVEGKYEQALIKNIKRDKKKNPLRGE